MIVLWLSLAGGFGAWGRFVADGLIRTVVGRKFPLATIIINISGSMVLGIVTGLALQNQIDTQTELVLGIGFCGGFTTFSTASFETVRLIEQHRFISAFIHALANIGLALLAAAAGLGFVLS